MNIDMVWTATKFPPKQFSESVQTNGESMELVAVSREAAQRKIEEYFNILESEEYNDGQAVKYLAEWKSQIPELRQLFCIVVVKVKLFR